MKKTFFALLVLYLTGMQHSCAQVTPQRPHFSRQDTLRGSISPERRKWNVLRYDLSVTPDFATKTIRGKNTITFYDSSVYTLQIDLQQPMLLDSALFENRKVRFTREGNVYWVVLRDSSVRTVKTGTATLDLYFHGKPREAVSPPWDGGWIWKRDARQRPWMSVAVQGLGASSWYPCKDHQSDEPDNGASLTITVPDTLVAVANGRLSRQEKAAGTASYTWAVKNPINNYNLVPYIGKYARFSETYPGEQGTLDLDYWVLDYNLEKARKQFTQVPQMLKAFEHWFGPYPFYADGFKLVEAPHLGMEHQSAIAYGNHFQNGYLGTDLSGTGWGKKWDYIIVHESGHEWFANNITTRDIADMWVHEGFTDYSETLFTEYYYGQPAANAYVQGLRKNIENDRPVIGPYGVNSEGSGDMYYKGANLIHTIRQVINDDEQFRQLLRGLNKTFYHQTVSSRDVENYMSRQSGRPLDKVFDQYLRTTGVPQLRLKTAGNTLHYRWEAVVPGFDMPVKLTNGQWLKPTTAWQVLRIEKGGADLLTADPNFYIRVNKGD